ncbi:MAG: RagB/SusD family nutrient uptake outer membrane protein [Bacteroidales bacterium]|nr:RagB/SusD family nutrient uptake outer membrane protein [Candidatus Liminaster caballi]
MKFNIVKSFLAASALVLSMGMTSCVNDLDVENINPQQTSQLDVDALFNKIYSSFVLTGQQGPSDKGDIAGIDEGRSEFFRMCFSLNEYTSDEAHWIWLGDTGMSELLHNTYGADNAQSQGLYYRLYFTITLCNFYLDQVNGTDAESLARRAEVRFIRSFVYYYVMDLYGSAAFMEHVSLTPGECYDRAKFFAYIESELKEIEPDLKDAGANTYGRVDKVAAWNLLSRLYLNANVYIGKEMWDEAMTYADKVINNGHYALHTTGTTNPVTGEVYSAYQMLFLADNDTNGAQKEMIYPVLCHGINTTSYGSTDFLILSTYSGEMSENVPSGTGNSWGKCMRVRSELIDKFTHGGDLPQTKVLADIITAAGDDRALFYTQGYTKNIDDEAEAAQGYSCVKFRNVRSDGASPSDNAFVDTDLPLMRVAEAYLTYAEASTRKSGPNAEATDKVNVLRARANAALFTENCTLDDLCDEWSREFWFEGRRRTDLVRFNRFGGQSKYTWHWMGGTVAGQQFPAYRNIFGLPVNDLANNANLTQNPNY